MNHWPGVFQPPTCQSGLLFVHGALKNTEHVLHATHQTAFLKFFSRIFFLAALASETQTV